MKNNRTLFAFIIFALIITSCQTQEQSLKPLAGAIKPKDMEPLPTARLPTIAETTSSLIVPNKDCSVLDLPEKPLTTLGVGAATAVGWSRSGTLLAVSSTVGTYLYDTEAKRQVGFFDTSQRKVSKIIFSLDDSLLLLGGEDGWLTIFDMKARALYKEIDAARIVGAPDDKRGIKEMFFSPRGTYFAVIMVSNNKKILWKAPEFNVISFEEKVGEDDKNADGFVFINDETAALIGTGVQVVALPTAAVKRTQRFRGDLIEHWALYNNTGNYEDTLVAWGSKAGFVTVNQLGFWRTKAYFNTTVDYPELMFSPDGKYLLIFKHGESNIEVWDVASSRLVRTLFATVASQTRFANLDPVNELRFSSDGRYLAAIGATVYVWDFASGEEVFSSPLIKYTDPEFVDQIIYYHYYAKDYPIYYNFSIERATQRVYNTIQPPRFAVTDQGDKIALVTPLYTVQAYAVASKAPLLKDQLDRFTLLANLQYSDNEMQIPIRGSDALTRFWNINYQTVESISPAQSTRLEKPALINWPGTSVKLPSQNLEATLDDLGRIEIKRDGQSYFKTNDSPGNSIAFSPDGKYLVTSHTSGTLNIWNVADKARIPPIREPSEIKYITFSPDGDYLISVGYGDLYDPDLSVRFIHIYKVETWESVTGTILDEGIHGTPIGFWPDSKTLVLERGHLKNGTHGPTLIRLSDGRIVREWPMSEIALSPNGTFLELLNPGKGTVEIWGCPGN